MAVRLISSITFGDLRRGNLKLEVGCKQCGYIAILDPHTLPFGDHEQIPKVSKKLKCGQCGAKAGYVRPEANFE